MSGPPEPAAAPVVEPAGATGAVATGAETPWRRLDRRTLLVTALVLAGVVLGAGLPTAVGMAGRMPPGEAVAWVVAGAALLVVAGTGGEYVRWRRTRYRIGPERAELHTGLFLVKRRSLARERIRSVDLTAHPLLRILGLVKVRIGTGEHSGGESTLELDPVTRAEGERLRTELLDRTRGEPGTHPEGMLAVLDPDWLRYAPLSFVAPVLGGAAAGGLLQISEWFGAQTQVIDWVRDRFENTPLVWTILILIAAAALAGIVGALGLWVEMWWNYRLEREPGGTLRVRRGLLTSRSVSIEERRLRGVELVEPLGVRLAGAARLDAIATGLTQDEEDEHADNKALLPAAPRAVAHAVAARVLREAVSPTDPRGSTDPTGPNGPRDTDPTGQDRLTPHPSAARSRRLRWSLAAALLPVALLAGLGLLLTDVLLPVAAACALLLFPAAVLLALDAYRNLGHGLRGAYLVARSGTVRRSTVALQRTGVIGWTVRQSLFQRRAGLVTLTATTAAGEGAYHVHDAAESEALAFAEEAVPGLLTPFLEPGKS
ncbi:PH domain-containing protein [Streptomyces sp. JV176]|uniref:PH domain-containing protein n=1 Tax=Streptomyces sp. JV176 TaxID=858630 RepID=UPI002E78940B|nr:PH domain-containing protein [Streptomyces sp. JV176]MEE1801723.1 PH domain-containing protein [Streptomyces sp. JV176]